MKPIPFIIAITGGIGSGKSAAAEIFCNLGIFVIDTDVIARDLVATGTPALAAISEHFGADVLNQESSLNRKALRERVFDNSDDRKWLENLLHPLINEQVLELIQAHSKDAYVVLVLPLLTQESSYNELIDRVLVIDVPESVQKERAASRDNTTSEAIERIMLSQSSREERLAIANDVIDNSGSTAHLAKQVQKRHEHYQRLKR